ncbi:PepSY domain-containing protein [Longimycelium tulufanense]|uniref:PepSY domain-containing protein n=1 Tax=Longimycelium tulufanense TaxID=907463 RepID=UPI00166C9D01|nr:PepSY domain-containing protein [Longimycelium tulufanense]
MSQVVLAFGVFGAVLSGCGNGGGPQDTVPPAPTATTPPVTTAPSPPPMPLPEIDRNLAHRIAQDAVAGGQITRVELETENGRLLWDIDATDAEGRRRDLDIDAHTGQVIRNQVED